MRRNFCSSCLKSWRRVNPLLLPRSIGLQNNDRIQRRSKGYIANAGEQAIPIQGFYAELMSHPVSKTQPATETSPTPPPPESLPKTQKEETLEKARIVFGSRLAGPGERQAEIHAKSKMIAGVLVPPRPEEPDNCCMSGCVNCVWDMYRDEMEEWAAKSAEARAALQAQREGGKGTETVAGEPGTASHVATSMDDDGGGSETNWVAGMEGEEEQLFGDIPVGIRQFMLTEKRLKQKHKEEQAQNA
ncbi:hypothetical protein GQ43DRAFT_375271 [Delitschia confertaspora ATCC 74209]|uniref:Oxidoreductase-like domain-containing protein n=1 Tax=Delitschia confertaspora ATCC 74209 TaxID=1513339 RepID=A0A9P4JI53_9PLEO|nr:hypothetical protein GQ43DRAFT_375271 [Delitschia confertaspora ATCC 74209]